MASMETIAGVSALHMIGLGISFGSLFARGRAFGKKDIEGALYADNWWGFAAIVVMGSGLARAFGGLEKGTAFYLASSAFQLKMALIGGVLLLELWPMFVLMRHRIIKGRGGDPGDLNWTGLYRANFAEVLLLVLVPFAAAFMARGYPLW